MFKNFEYKVYMIKIEKPLEKKKILDLYYKQLSSKDAVLYNDTEDLKLFKNYCY